MTDKERLEYLFQHPDEVTSRADAEGIVKLVTRICRGPCAPRYKAAKEALLAEGRHEEAAAMDDAGRRYPFKTEDGEPHPKGGEYVCGAQDNDVICAGPFDGKLHEYVCSCGLTRRYTAPYFENLPENKSGS